MTIAVRSLVRQLVRPRQRPGSPAPLTVFIHIPKTAGSSFRAVIEHNVPAARRVEIYRTETNVTLAKCLWDARDAVDGADIVMGHIEHRVHEFVERECRYITILREPIDRVLSIYRYIKYDFVEHPMHRQFNNSLTFDRWLSRWPKIATNVMTKMISGLATEYETSTPPMLPRAIHNLQNMPAFGVQERFEESVDSICRALGWEATYPSLNRSSLSQEEFCEREKIGPEIIEQIKTINRLDLQLYDEAQRLLDKAQRRQVGV